MQTSELFSSQTNLFLLHLDMSKHFSTVARIKSQASKSWDEMDAKLRFEILMYMLHLADISNAG